MALGNVFRDMLEVMRAGVEHRNFSFCPRLHGSAVSVHFCTVVEINHDHLAWFLGEVLRQKRIFHNGNVDCLCVNARFLACMAAEKGGVGVCVAVEACLLRFFKDHACIFERNRAAVQRFLCRAVVNQSAVECDGIAAFAVESELF